MSEASRDFSELQGLLDRLMLGNLDAAGHAKLDELVVADLSTRRRYIEQMFLIGELRFRLGKVAAAATVPGQVSVQPVSLRTRVRSVIPAFIQRRPVTWSILAAGLLFATYVALISWGMLDRGRRTDRFIAQSASDKELSTVATIRQTADVEWSDHVDKSLRDLQTASRRDASTVVAAGEPLAIDSGLVELQLKQGVTLVVEGPAKWSIDGKNNATLKQGKLVAKVPQQAIGFTLQTPTAKIVDLGTEFGVEVQPDGRSILQVLKGEVETRSHAASAKSVRLSAGQSIQFVSGSPNPESIHFDGLLFANLARHSAQSLRQNMPVLLFADNFSVVRASDDINPSANDKPGRQSGLLAPLRYLEREGKAAATTQLGNAPAPHGLLYTGDAQARTLVSPAIDFVQQKEQPGRYTVEFFVNPGRRFDGAPDTDGNWGGVHVGARDPIAQIPGADGGVVFLIRGTGGYQLFEGEQLVREGSLREALANADLSGWSKVRIVFQVPAFDGVSPCLVRSYVNGQLILEHRTTAGFTNNFIGLDGLSSAGIYHAFDDFQVLYEEGPFSEEKSR
jgi:hypothetical protein